ncbi:hypothetical protein PTUN_a3436 [Pseudoalteromonas tunicata]|nr:hypothetical protein PTUN_a3436 [Pseudoalteromonas tunicata]
MIRLPKICALTIISALYKEYHPPYQAESAINSHKKAH